jgi:rubrerythrin
MYENMNDILKGLDLKEILGYAIGSEDTASTYYRMLVKIFDTNELVANKFENIAKDEELHKQSLLNLYKEVYGSDQYTVPDGLPPFESRAEVDSVGSLLRALEIAMENEQNAYKIYTFLASEHKAHRKLFKYLAQTELGHYETLKQEKGYFDEEVAENPDLGNRAVTDVYRMPTFKPADIR